MVLKVEKLAACLLTLALLAGALGWMRTDSAVAWSPDQYMVVVASGNEVHAHDWPVGEEVTLEIDDPGTPQDPDFTGTLMPEQTDDGSFAVLSFWEQFDVQTGHTVTLAGSGIVKEHTVTRLQVLSVDTATGIVIGIAEPGGAVEVDLFEGEDFESAGATADADGNWEVDFARTFTADSWLMTHESDDDGDETSWWWWQEPIPIDIRPGSRTNSIHLGSRGALPVAVLTTAEFDAGTVDPATVLFAGATPVRWTLEDVDRDGDADLQLYFQIPDLDLYEDSTEATLTGLTFGGAPFRGTDTVNIVP